MKTRGVIWVLLGLCGICVVGAVSMLIYTSIVISSTPIKEKLSEVQSFVMDEYNGGSLEEGSIVKGEQLEAYLSFSKSDMSPEDWIATRVETGYFAPYQKKFYELVKDVQLPPILSNHCKRVYCHQSRLPFREIPRVFWKGLIGIEDNRYVHHIGIDPRSILRALVKDVVAMRFVEGGSTITQQLVKNLFYSNKRSIIRKVNEIIIAVYIEQNYSKEAILEAYFNEIVWGSLQGMRIKGIGAASLFYFGKNLKFLKPYEASILISLLKGPAYYHPIKHTQRLKERASVVFKRLLELNFFAKNEIPWGAPEWNQWVIELKAREVSRPYHTLWKTYELGQNENDFYEKLVLNQKVKELLLSIDEQKRKDHQIESKLIISKWVGGEFKETYRLYSNVERSLKSAVEDEAHQLGSILKPIIYKIFLDHGKSLSDEVSVLPVTLKLKSGQWSPRESHRLVVNSLELRETLQQSLNNPIIRIAEEVGFDYIEKKLLPKIPTLQKPLSEFPAQLLGAVELPITKVARIYEDFVKDACFGGDENARLVLRELVDPNLTTVRKATMRQFKSLRFFGKTGTANYGNHNWFVAFDGVNFYALWVGASGIKAKESLKLYGSTTAFRIFQNFLRERGKTFPVLDCLE